MSFAIQLGLFGGLAGLLGAALAGRLRIWLLAAVAFGGAVVVAALGLAQGTSLGQIALTVLVWLCTVEAGYFFGALARQSLADHPAPTPTAVSPKAEKQDLPLA